MMRIRPWCSAVVRAVLAVSVSETGLIAQTGFSREVFHDHAKLSWKILQTKAKGGRQLVLGGGQSFFSEVAGLDAELKSSSVILVEPIEQLTEVYHDSSLVTWYRLRVLEKLAIRSLDPAQRPVTEQLDAEMPSAIRPKAENEIAIRRSGGTLLVEGIQVIEEQTPFRALALNVRYLLFCQFDTVLKIAAVPDGSDGVYKLVDDDTLLPVGKKDFSVARDIRELHGNSLRLLRGYMK